MTIDFNLGSYVMQCVLDDPDQTVITVEYLKKTGQNYFPSLKRGGITNEKLLLKLRTVKTKYYKKTPSKKDLNRLI